MTLKIFKKKPLIWLYVGGALLVVAALVFWCIKMSTDPERVFWQTIERGLATRGVTVHSEQTSSGTNANQTIRYSLGAANLSHSVTTLSQEGTTVKNEMIGTSTVDYTRYVDIKTDQKKADGSPIDPSKLLGVWAKGQVGSNQFFSQAVFGASLPVGGMGVPLANLQADARAKLVKQIRNDATYTADFSKTKKERVNGRLQYTYEVEVQPVAYVAMMKQFSSDVGLHGLDQVDPANYKGQKPFKLFITVDARAHQVTRITAPDTGGEQTYSSYDVPVQADLPKNAITGAELQKLLSDLQ